MSGSDRTYALMPHLALAAPQARRTGCRWEIKVLIQKDSGMLSLAYRWAFWGGGGIQTVRSTAVPPSSRESPTSATIHPFTHFPHVGGDEIKKYFSLWLISCLYLIAVFPEPIHQSQYFNQSVRSAIQIVNNQVITPSVILCLTNETIIGSIYIYVEKGSLLLEEN